MFFTIQNIRSSKIICTRKHIKYGSQISLKSLQKKKRIQLFGSFIQLSNLISRKTWPNFYFHSNLNPQPSISFLYENVILKFDKIWFQYFVLLILVLFSVKKIIIINGDLGCVRIVIWYILYKIVHVL